MRSTEYPISSCALRTRNSDCRRNPRSADQHVVCRNFFGAEVELLNCNLPAGVERPRTRLANLLGEPHWLTLKLLVHLVNPDQWSGVLAVQRLVFDCPC